MNLEQLEDRELLATDLVIGTLFGPSANSETLVTATGSVSSMPGIDLPLFHDEYKLDGTGYAVAVIDSGIDYKHPALGGTFGKSTSTVVDGYDFVDGTGGGFVEGDSTPGPDADPMDVSGHGTSVAGILAANDDNYEGIAPGVDLIALRVLDANGQGKWSWVAGALQWVIDNYEEHNIVAVNMSFGDGNLLSTPAARQSDVEPLLRQLNDLGIVLVASSGNEYFTHGSTAGLQYPAVSSEVISVGATYDANQGARTWPSGAIDHSSGLDRITAFTQRSAGLDLLAPGAIVTTTTLSNGGSENYQGYAGTSQAAPFVTAAAVLLHQALDQTGQSSQATPAKILSLLKSTGVQVYDGDNEHDNVTNTKLTYSRVDIHAALDAVYASAPSPKPTADRYEGNDTNVMAAALGNVTNLTKSNLTWHTKTDTDWYSFTAAKAGSFRIVVDAVEGSEVRFVFHDYSVNRSRTLTAIIKNGEAVLDVDLRDKVNYFLQVSPSSVGIYDLSIQYLGESTSSPGTVNNPQSNPLTLTPDKYEANNTSQTATFLGFVRNAQFDRVNLHNSSDIDWYRFLSLEKGLRRIEITPVNPTNANIQFSLTNTATGKVLTSTKEGSKAVLETNLDILNYLLKVNSASGSVVEYTIRIVPVKDSLESNGAMIDAPFIGQVTSQTELALTIHEPGDIDWLRFQADYGDFEIEVIPGAGTAVAQFTFIDPTKNKPRTIESTLVDGDAYLKVTLRGGVNYFLNIRATDNSTFSYELRISRVTNASAAGLLSIDDKTNALDAVFSQWEFAATA